MSESLENTVTRTLEANKELVRRAFEAWDDGDPDAFDDVYAEDIVHHDSELGGRDDLKALVPVWFDAFPNLSHTVEAMVAEGDWVTTRFTISGTHEGEFRVSNQRVSSSKFGGSDGAN